MDVLPTRRTATEFGASPAVGAVGLAPDTYYGNVTTGFECGSLEPSPWDIFTFKVIPHTSRKTIEPRRWPPKTIGRKPRTPCTYKFPEYFALWLFDFTTDRSFLRGAVGVCPVTFIPTIKSCYSLAINKTTSL